MGYFFSSWGSIGVDIFFVLSGFVIFLSSQNKQTTSFDFMRNRLARIAPPYWVVTFITLAIIIALPNIRPQMKYDVFSIKHFIASLLFAPYPHPAGFGQYPFVTVGWSLNFEIAFYLIFAFTLMPFVKKKLTALFIGVLLIFWALPKLGLLSSFYNNLIALEFVAGVAIAAKWKKANFTSSLQKSLILLALTILSMFLFKDSARVYRFGVPSILFVLSFLHLESYLKKWPLIIKLGDLSYSTYLFHALILSLGVYVNTFLNMPTLLIIGLCYVLTVFVSWLSYNILELKMTRILKKMSTKQATQP